MEPNTTMNKLVRLLQLGNKFALFNQLSGTFNSLIRHLPFGPPLPAAPGTGTWHALPGTRLLRIFGLSLFPQTEATTIVNRAEPVTPAEQLHRVSLAPWAEHKPFFWHSPEPNAPQPADPGAFISGRYHSTVGTRDYKLYIPSRYMGQALPLVVMLHGCKQNPDAFAIATRMNDIAEEYGFFVLYPAQDRTANGYKCWNWFEASHQQRGQGEPSIIAGVTRRIIREYPIDTHRVYVAGLSAGGAMAAVMGATYPDLYAAIGVHSGLPYAAACDMQSALNLMRHGPVPIGRRANDGLRAVKKTTPIIPTIIFHGDCDTRVHPRNGDRAVDDWVDVETVIERGRVHHGHAYTRTVFRHHRRRSVLEQWRVHGAGHAWSGGNPHASYTDHHGPDASREMARFFYEHPRRHNNVLWYWFNRTPHRRDVPLSSASK